VGEGDAVGKIFDIARCLQSPRACIMKDADKLCSACMMSFLLLANVGRQDIGMASPD
jgi:hypothetical protein